MSSATCNVLLYGQNSSFFEYASFHLAAHGIRVVPVLNADRLAEIIHNESPSLVLLHWDTLGESSLQSCRYLRTDLKLMHTPIAIVSEQLRGSISIVLAVASGADDLIEGALNPRIFWSRIRSLLGLRDTPLAL